ncbi:amidase family protein, partial [Sphingomonas bacterium]|uniref:amidase family protein n=1 Tax=Sphingomonas bacterium TaxID=1895847 RepID=UPI0020C69AB1
ERVGAALARDGARVDTASELLPDLAGQHARYRRMLTITLTRGAAWLDGGVATASDWFDALDEQARTTRAWRRLFERYHAVIAPPNVVTAFAHRDDPYDARTLTIDGVATAYDAQLAWPGVATYPGLPATCFPAGVDQDGLPTGAQVIAAPFADHTAIAVARAAHGLVWSR